MWSGSLAWTTPVLAPGETYLHVAFVSFTASGVYGVGMSASYLPVKEGGGGLAAFAKSQRGSLGEGYGIVESEGGPLLYWGHESQVLLITEMDGRRGEEGGERRMKKEERQEEEDINDLMGGSL